MGIIFPTNFRGENKRYVSNHHLVGSFKTYEESSSSKGFHDQHRHLFGMCVFETGTTSVEGGM